MRSYPFEPAVRLAILLSLAAGWLVGLAVQVGTRLATGYMDVMPPQLLLAVLLVLGAGACARAFEPVRRAAWRGAVAGVAMVGAIVLGYAIVTALMWNPAWGGDDGETAWSFLLEAWFWIGVPLAVGAGGGAIGWLAADRAAARQAG